MHCTFSLTTPWLALLAAVRLLCPLAGRTKIASGKSRFR